MLVFVLVVPLVVAAATLEQKALQDKTRYAAMLVVLGIAWAAARYRTTRQALRSDSGVPAFDAEPEDRTLTLELWDKRFNSVA